MKILLIVPPVVYARQAPIGIAYLAAYLKAKKYEVKSWDLNIEILISNDCDDRFWALEENCSNFFQNHKNLFNEWVEKILDYHPQVIGFSIWESNEYFALRLAEMIKMKNENILIIFGGPQSTYKKEKFIQDSAVDIVIYGEGEEVLFEVVELHKNNGRVDFCCGALVKNSSRIIDGGFMAEISDLDSLPYPDYSDFRLESYLFKNHIPISFSRGCAWHCSYCQTNFHWKKFRIRKPEGIYLEILHGLKEYPLTKRFEVCDAALNQSLNLISRLCDLIISGEINIEFAGFAQIRPEMNFEMLKKMKKAGFTLLNYGVESGSQEVLNSMGRKYSVEDAERIIKYTYNAGIHLALNFIVGYPNETEEDFHKTIRFIERIRGFVSNIGPASECGIPYSYIYSHPEEFNIIIPENRTFWRTTDGSNTHEERQKRLEVFNEFIRSLGLSNRSPAQDREFLKDG